MFSTIYALLCVSAIFQKRIVAQKEDQLQRGEEALDSIKEKLEKADEHQKMVEKHLKQHPPTI